MYLPRNGGELIALVVSRFTSRRYLLIFTLCRFDLLGEGIDITLNVLLPVST